MNESLHTTANGSIDDLTKDAPRLSVENLNLEHGSPAGRLYAFICIEVQKFLQAKRVTEMNIRELDQKIHMETFLREKKEAILEDRKCASPAVFEEDQKSKVEQVKEKYAHLAQEAEARSRVSKARSIGGRSAKPGDQASVTSAMRLKDRLNRDFGAPTSAGPKAVPCIVTDDTITVVSGFEDEVDEWAALNKYNMLVQYQKAQQAKLDVQKRKERMRIELIQQQEEYAARKEKGDTD